MKKELTFKPLIYNSLGKKDPKLHQAKYSIEYENLDTLPVYFNRFTYHVYPPQVPLNIFNTNMSGIYGVMPCRPDYNFIRILKRDEGDIMGGIYPSQGYARHQKGGLLSQKIYPTNLKLTPKADSFNSALNSKLGQPRG